MGLLNAIVPREQLLDTAYEYARRITANAPLAVQATKQSVWEGLGMSLRDAYQNESRAQLDDLPDRGRQGRPEGVRGEAHAELAGEVAVRAVDPRTPCLIGVGQQTWHPDEVGDDGRARAARDVGGRRPRRRRRQRRCGAAVLERLDSAQIVYCQTWQYDDPRGAARRRASASSRGTPHLLGHRRHDAAGAGARTRRSRSSRASSTWRWSCGAEALATQRRYKQPR